MKWITLIICCALTIFTPLKSIASTCPFNELNIQPKWINDIAVKDEVIIGIGLEKYNQNTHVDLFDLRKHSESRAKQALAQNLGASIYNSVLNSKKVANGKLVKNVQSIVKQVSELSLPESYVEARWLDTKNCILWTKINVGSEQVNEYVDEISEMESEVNEHLDSSLVSSIIENLNSKQYFLNYNGFSKAVNEQATLTYKGITKPALSWMIDNGFDIFEPSLVASGINIDGVSRYLNTNSFEFFMYKNELTKGKMSYILDAYVQSTVSYLNLMTPILSHEGTKAVYLNKNAGIKFMRGTLISRTDAPFALGLRFTKDQPFWDVPKVTNIYGNKSIFYSGNFSLLHLAVIYKRADLVEEILKAGGDPNIKDINNMTPAQYAVAIEDETIIELFLNNRTDLAGVYATAAQKSIYITNNFLYEGYDISGEKNSEHIQMMSMFGSVDYSSKILFKYKKAFKAKDKNNIKSTQKLLQQSIEAIDTFSKTAKYKEDQSFPPIALTKTILDKSVKRLKDMM